MDPASNLTCSESFDHEKRAVQVLVAETRLGKLSFPFQFIRFRIKIPPDGVVFIDRLGKVPAIRMPLN